MTAKPFLRIFRPIRPIAFGLLIALVQIGVAVAQEIPEKCKEFVAYGLPANKGVLLCRTGYALAHDEQRKTPLWVAQRMTPERLENRVSRSDRFIPDPDLPKGKRAELEDYRGSGYDRGHMAPAADMRWSREAMAESFYLSNMAPQVGPGMNRGIWADIEKTIRRWVAARGELFIFTGPIFEQQTKPLQAIGPNRVTVPSHFYKIVFDPLRVETIAFVVPNAPHPNRNIDEFITSVRDIESRTGLDFLNRISPAVQNAIEEVVAPALWQ